MLRAGACLTILGMIVAMAVQDSCAVQVKDQESGASSKTVVRTVDVTELVPFSLSASPGSAEGVEFRAAEAMTQEDRQAASQRWLQIKAIARENGFDLDRKGWKYEQIVSPVFSQHVLLLFLHEANSEERSEFSAILPSNSQEPLRIIPILRRGYFPYATSPENLVTMAAFNRARASERKDKKPYWLSVAFCYAALNGEHAFLPSAQMNKGNQGAAIWVATPSLRAEDYGTAVARFAVEDAHGGFAEWELTFDRDGNVVNAVTSRVRSPKLKVVRVEDPKQVRKLQ